MGGVLRVRVDGGGEILVRLPDEPGVDHVMDGPVEAGVGDRGVARVREASASLGEMLEPALAIAAAVRDRLRKAGPSELQVTFGIELAAEGGVVVAKAAAGTYLEVTLAWTRDDLQAGR